MFHAANFAEEGEALLLHSEQKGIAEGVIKGELKGLALNVPPWKNRVSHFSGKELKLSPPKGEISVRKSFACMFLLF